MANYLIRNVVTNEVLGPYPEDMVPVRLWGKNRSEWVVFKQMAMKCQAVANRICKRRSRNAENRPVSPKNEKIAARS